MHKPYALLAGLLSIVTGTAAACADIERSLQGKGGGQGGSAGSDGKQASSGGSAGPGGQQASLGGSPGSGGQQASAGGMMAGQGGAHDAGAGGVAGDGANGGVGGARPGPLPSTTFPHCIHEGLVGYTGPCCEELQCYTPPPGEGCKAVEDLHTAPICLGATGGVCICGDTRGPFAGPVGDRSQLFNGEGFCGPSDDGPCCYVVPLHWCTGRPLRVGGLWRVAIVVRGQGWG